MDYHPRGPPHHLKCHHVLLWWWSYIYDLWGRCSHWMLTSGSPPPQEFVQRHPLPLPGGSGKRQHWCRWDTLLLVLLCLLKLFCKFVHWTNSFIFITNCFGDFLKKEKLWVRLLYPSTSSSQTPSIGSTSWRMIASHQTWWSWHITVTVPRAQASWRSEGRLGSRTCEASRSRLRSFISSGIVLDSHQGGVMFRVTIRDEDQSFPNLMAGSHCPWMPLPPRFFCENPVMTDTKKKKRIFFHQRSNGMKTHSSNILTQTEFLLAVLFNLHSALLLCVCCRLYVWSERLERQLLTANVEATLLLKGHPLQHSHCLDIIRPTTVMDK